MAGGGTGFAEVNSATGPSWHPCCRTLRACKDPPEDPVSVLLEVLLLAYSGLLPALQLMRGTERALRPVPSPTNNFQSGGLWSEWGLIFWGPFLARTGGTATSWWPWTILLSESRVFSEICQCLVSHKIRTTPLDPPSDGLGERLNLHQPARLGHPVALPAMQDSTNCTPALLMLGREPQTRLSCYLAGRPGRSNWPRIRQAIARPPG